MVFRVISILFLGMVIFILQLPSNIGLYGSHLLCKTLFLLFCIYLQQEGISPETYTLEAD